MDTAGANESKSASGDEPWTGEDSRPSSSNFYWDPVAATEDKSSPPTAAPPSPTEDLRPSSSSSFWDPVAATDDKSSPPTAAPPSPTSPPPDSQGSSTPVKTCETKALGAGGYDSAGVLLDQSKQPPSDIDSSTSESIHNNPRMSWLKKTLLWVLAFAVLATSIALLAFSLKKVSSTEMGVQYDIHAKQLNDAIKSGGLFVGPPGYEFIKFPSTFITVDLDNRVCVSNDGLLVTFSVTFQYQMTAQNILPAILKYRNFDKWASMVEQAGLSAIHHSCSEFFISEFQNKRGEIQGRMEESLRKKLGGDESSGDEGVHAVAVSLQLSYIGLPDKYNTAVSEKQAAKEEIELAVKEREQEVTKANTALGKAREEVQKIRDTANNEAEVLLTEANLKAQETLFSFQKEAEALVEVKKSLNFTTEGLLAYLSNKLISEARNLKVTTGEPAKLSQRDEL